MMEKKNIEKNTGGKNEPSESRLACVVRFLQKNLTPLVELIKRTGIQNRSVGYFIGKLLDFIILFHKCIGRAFFWLIKMCCVPFRYINAGITYAFLFLLVICGLLVLKNSGDSIALMKNPRELQPARLRNQNTIRSTGTDQQTSIVMQFPALEKKQNSILVELLKKSREIEMKFVEDDEWKKKKEELSSQDFAKEKAQRDEKKDKLLRALVQKAKPLIGFDAHALQKISKISVRPPIFVVTCVIYNVNQGGIQPFHYIPFDPTLNIAADIDAPLKDEEIQKQLDLWINIFAAYHSSGGDSVATLLQNEKQKAKKTAGRNAKQPVNPAFKPSPDAIRKWFAAGAAPLPEVTAALCRYYWQWKEEKKKDDSVPFNIDWKAFRLAEWELQTKLISMLVTQVHDKQNYEGAYDIALKKKEKADKKAQKLKDQEKRRKILNMTVHDYFCDQIGSAERTWLEIFIRATNLIEKAQTNQHSVEKIYLYVSSHPQQVRIDFSNYNELPSADTFFEVMQYPERKDFAFFSSTADSVEKAFDAANTKIFSPAEQRKRLTKYLERDIIAEEVEKENSTLALEAERKNRRNKVDLENEILLAISQRPEGSPPLTPEILANIKTEVILKHGQKEEKPKLKKKEDYSQNEKAQKLDAAIAEAGINPENLFYSSLIVDSVRENNQTSSVESFVSDNITFWLLIFFGFCALAAFCVTLSWHARTAFNTVCKWCHLEKWQIRDGDQSVVVAVRNCCFWIVLLGLIGFIIYWSLLFLALCDVPDQILNLLVDKELFTPYEKSFIWLYYFWFWIPGLILAVIAICALFTPGVKKDFSRPDCGRNPFAELFTGKNGNAPFAGSFTWVILYLLLFLLLPYLENFQYINVVPNIFATSQAQYTTMDSYEIPGGGGDSAPAQVIKKKTKPKKTKKFIVSNRTSIIFEIPPLNDDEHLEEIDSETETQYATGTMFGKGKNKGRPGWAAGIENAKLRFIRLQHGGDWAYDMGKGGDYKMLMYFRDKLNFKVAVDVEATTADKLARGFRKGKKPPFIYIHGKYEIRFSSSEKKQLAEYLLKDGGLIFADAGSPTFGRSFRQVIKEILPNHNLVDISNDDEIFKHPYIFPNGAPSFFHHDGNRALGIKNNGRWIVIYHPGDLGDVWKGAGLSKQQTEQGFALGANIINYAFEYYIKSNNLGQ